MKSNFWAAAAFVGVFVLGAIAGAGGTRAYMLEEFGSPFEGPPREVGARLRVEAMRRQLGLSPSQVSKIKTILQESIEDHDNAMKPCRTEMDALRKRIDERVIETLDQTQIAKYREFSEKMHKRRGRGPLPRAHPSGFSSPPPH
jgi:regulator of replication initiation timing